MGGYITGVLVALATVFCLYAGLEFAAGNSLFHQEPMVTVSTANLLKAAEDNLSADQVDAIVQLGKRPKDIEKTFSTLAGLTMSNEHLVKTAAESALHEIGAPAAKFVRPLLEAKEKSKYQIGCSTIRAIGPSCKIYMPEIKALLKSDDFFERRCGLFALQGLKDEAVNAMDGIIICLNERDYENKLIFNNQVMACRICEGLGRKAEPAREALMKVLEEGLPSTRGYAAICLASMDRSPSDSKIIELIAEKMQGQAERPLNPVEHKRYIHALGLFGSKASDHLEKIREKLKHRDKFIQLHSAFAIYKISGKADESMDVFKSLIEQEVYAADALELVSQMGDKALPFVPSIMNCLDSSEPGNREMALTALANIGPKAKVAIGKVEELLTDKDALVRIAARETLKILKNEEQAKK